MSTTPHWLRLPEGTGDVDLLSQVKRALREAERSAALVIAGSFSDAATDADSRGDLIGLLLDAPIPVLATASGPVGPRGLALLLAADRAVIGPGSRTSRDWRASPGLVSLLNHRLGPARTRAMLFDPSSDILAHLADHGHTLVSDDPDAEVQAIAAALGHGLGSRLKRALRASTELPLKEAVGFDLWLARSPMETAS